MTVKEIGPAVAARWVFFVRATLQVHAQDKFIAFLDIIGFSALVEQAERSGGDLTRPIELMRALEASTDVQRLSRNGSAICPQSRRIARDLDFQATQVSDCLVASVEISPAGVINLASHCFGIVLALMRMGALCRGVIKRGNIFHRDGRFLGTGYMQAYGAEGQVAFLRSEAGENGTPFVQIDGALIDFVRDETDDCVRKMFTRITHSDGTYTAIYPFKALGKVPSSIVGMDFDPVRWKASLQTSFNNRLALLAQFNEQEQCAPDDRSRQKICHYKRGLEEVLDRLRAKEAALDRMIATSQIPYGTVWL